MNKSWFLLAAVLLVGPTFAEDSRRPAVPQPRVRLDPNTRTAVPATRSEERKPAAADVVAMSPMVVRSTVIAAEDPQQVPQPPGPFSLLEGGWISRRGTNGVRLEVGMWPYRNILWKNDRFKSDLKHVGTEFVRVTW